MQLQNKIALVTGSTTGIGEAIARRFLEEGARVLLHGRPEESAAAAPLLELWGERVGFCAAQLERPEECEALVTSASERFGGLDIVVNNAAAITRSNLETTDEATFDYTMAVNARAPLLIVRAALPYFRRAGGGCVLNIGSINAFCGEANQLAYAMSKGALMTLSRNLADAHARENIRVNHLNPGWVLTSNEHALKQSHGLAPDWPQHIPPAFAPSGRILSPDEIAHFALAFVAPGGGPISGAVVELEQYPVIGRNPVKEPPQEK